MWTHQTTGPVKLDSPTMIQIIIQGIDPTNYVGVSESKKNTQNSKLSMIGNRKDTIAGMDANYQVILAYNHTNDDYTTHLFDAILTSNNEVFWYIVQRKEKNWEFGEDVNPNKLIDESVAKFNNTTKQNLWNHSDSKDANIVALMTKLETL